MDLKIRNSNVNKKYFSLKNIFRILVGACLVIYYNLFKKEPRKKKDRNKEVPSRGYYKRHRESNVVPMVKKKTRRKFRKRR